MASSITLMTSCVPPEAVLSPWSAMTTGPSAWDLAACHLDRQWLGMEQEGLRAFSHAVSRIWFNRTSPSAVPLVAYDDGREGARMRDVPAWGKARRTPRRSAPDPNPRPWLAMLISVFIGSRDGPCGRASCS